MASLKPKVKKRKGWTQGFVFGRVVDQYIDPRNVLLHDKPKRKGAPLK